VLLGAVDIGLAGVAEGMGRRMVILRAFERLEVDELEDVRDRPPVERGHLALGDNVAARNSSKCSRSLNRMSRVSSLGAGVLDRMTLAAVRMLAFHFDSFPPGP